MAAAKALELSIDPSKARCVELECLLQAKTAHISHLEVRPLTQCINSTKLAYDVEMQHDMQKFIQAERDAQARSHAVRLAELQESCHKKVRQLQQFHREQLSAAQATAAAALTAAAAPAASAAVAGTKLTKASDGQHTATRAAGQTTTGRQSSCSCRACQQQSSTTSALLCSGSTACKHAV